MVDATKIPQLSAVHWAPSPRFLGGVSLASGGVALALVLSGFGSAILLGATMIPWILCGRAIHLDPERTSARDRLLAGALMWSAAAAALAVVAKLYLLALGPSWIL